MAETVEIDDKKYPQRLKEALKNLTGSLGPKKLYYKGNWSPEIFENCLAVVGSRHLTYYGRKATEQLVTECAAAGITIVSGFMYGGDEAAHSAAVKCGGPGRAGKTIAVMPCGIDRIHPETQKKLYQEILEKGGLIISEYPDLDQPQQWTYVQRDRIVAGLCKAVLVTEAALESGSLITASYAKKFGRKIFAIPGPITSELSKGTIKLIKEGAEPITEAKQILDFFKILPSAKKPSASNGGMSDIPPTGTLEEKIINQLRREPLKADEMARLFAVPVAQLGTSLSLMQLKGFINLEGGKYYIN
ncbi:MAG: DNA-processing protein DprA [Candidatus Staskawiczbacteria bacterium]|nr:DNA-processing protein DprA [Candidatus Staskawiczbacteria bacterium]